MYFKNLIKKISDWSCDENYLKQLSQASALDEHYTNLLEANQLLKNLSVYYPSSENEKAREKLAQLQKKVIDFYLSSFKDHQYVGSDEAYEKPDLLIGLGCKQPNLEFRAHGLAKLAKQHVDTDILMCGAGYDSKQTEARWLQSFLVKSGIDVKRTLIEEDAMDTVGHAVFSKLYLRKLGRLSEVKNIIIVTSGFHANRTFNIFMKVYGETSKIAVEGVGTINTSDLERRRVIGELKSDAVSSEQIFRSRDFFESSCLQSEDIPDGDEVAFFYQLLMHHDFYKRRFDLIRKYNTVLP